MRASFVLPVPGLSTFVGVSSVCATRHSGAGAFERTSLRSRFHSGSTTGDGVVNGGDLGLLLAMFGAAGPDLEGDLNDDGVVDALDLGILIGDWNG